MSTQIDPLTGLPMVFDSIIEQIPLNAQIFPYADLGATARPTASPLYPDSIIPVSAFLSGQHPDTGSAQTVATDGQHNLNVHVKASDAGGGSFVATNFASFSVLNVSAPAGTNVYDYSFSGIDDTWFIAGAQASCSVDVAGTLPATGSCSFQVELHFIPVFTNMWLLTNNFAWGMPTPTSGAISAASIWTPPTPIKIPLFSPLGNRNFGFDYKSDCDIIFSMIVFMCQQA